jgi:two-component system chemotaxis response regulator CheB
VSVENVKKRASQKAGRRRNVIVIGASAGGVQALQTLVSGLPRDLPASVFVVLHTSNEASHLADILNRNGNMPVAFALNGSPILQSRVFVARPNYHLMLKDGRMWLTIGPKVNRHRPAIDPLFESAAEVYGNRVIGVVLTGYRDDGSAGLSTIKEHGGIAIVQDPKQAFAPNMPGNALRLVATDYCLGLEEIAPLLVKLVNGRTQQKGAKKSRKQRN